MFDKRLFKFPGAKRIVLLCVATSLLSAALTVAQAAALAWALTLLWQGNPLESAAAYLFAFALCFIGKQALAVSQEKRLDRFTKEQSGELRRRLTGQIYGEGTKLTQELGTGAATALCLEGIAHISQYLRTALPRTIALAIVPVALLAAIVSQDWVSALIALLVFPAIVLQMVLIGSTAQAQAGKQHREYQRLANHFTDSVRGLDTLKYFGRSNEQADKVYETSEHFRTATMKTLRTATLSGAVLDAFSTISLAAVAIMLGFRLVDGSLSLFPALFVLVMMPDYFRPIREFASDYHATLNGKNALSQVYEVLGGQPGNTRAHQAEKAVAQPHPTTDSQAEDALRQACGFGPWQPASTLELRHLGFSYEGNRGKPALQNISLTFDGTGNYGIVGPSGCGKSTLAQLLAGVTSPTSGTVAINGREASTLSVPEWQKQVAYLPQNPHIFNATLQENLTFYQPDATNEEIAKALESVGLCDLVEKLPNGIETVVGEGGRSLSGGQAQRVALARAALHRTCRILVFDEPTAHLDIETEWELKQHMTALMQGKLVLFATHRLHWLAEMDKILLLDEGGIKAFGTLEELNGLHAFDYLNRTAKEGNHGK